MITYPILKHGAVIGVTASSLGVDEQHRDIFDEAVERMEARGYQVIVGETVYKQDKARSAPGKERGWSLTG